MPLVASLRETEDAHFLTFGSNAEMHLGQMKYICDIGKTNIMKEMLMKLKMVVIVCAVLACATFSYATAIITIGNANVVEMTDTINSLGLDPTSAEVAWLIGSQTSPRYFGYYAADGYWLKNLNTVQPVGHDEEINLVEWINISGTNLAIWSETVQTPGWVFSTDADDTWYSTDNGVTKLGFGNYGSGDTTVQIPISPALASSTTVMIHTELMWTGGEGAFNGYVQVAQTVPEPCAFVLLACGLVGLLVMRRRFV
jgi:hypothetical protein